jgi:hypothetical protein
VEKGEGPNDSEAVHDRRQCVDQVHDHRQADGEPDRPGSIARRCRERQSDGREGGCHV